MAEHDITLTVNGDEHELSVEPRTLLVHALRDELGYTGTNVGCESSLCGACTVHLDGDAVSESGKYDTDQDGFYVQGVYQFMPRWRVGLRYDWLSADNDTPGISSPTPFDDDDREPDRYTIMLDFWRLLLVSNHSSVTVTTSLP